MQPRARSLRGRYHFIDTKRCDFSKVHAATSSTVEVVISSVHLNLNEYFRPVSSATPRDDVSVVVIEIDDRLYLACCSRRCVHDGW